MIRHEGVCFTDGQLVAVSFLDPKGQQRRRVTVAPSGNARGIFDWGVAETKVIFLVTQGQIRAQNGAVAKAGEGLMFDPGQRVHFSCDAEAEFTHRFHRDTS